LNRRTFDLLGVLPYERVRK